MTENQIVILNEHLSRFIDYIQAARPERIMNVQKIYKNDEYMYLYFDFDEAPDANPLWNDLLHDTKYILETNDLEKKTIWTRDNEGKTYEHTLSWQIVLGELFPEIREKYSDMGEVFCDEIFMNPAIDYSNQEEINAWEAEKLNPTVKKEESKTEEKDENTEVFEKV